ncbi:MAG: J domain-containing protein [Thermoflexibacter sp.]|jgi:hypothetical protein|nr:J domain-containing protein [Thermoflexibacter sp.]
MFDRIFNILRANLGDVFQVQEEKISKEDWELYEQYQKNKQQEEQQTNEQSYQQSWQQQQEEKQYYGVLELPHGASFEQIKIAYKRLIKQYHPDRFHNDPEKHKAALEISQKLNIAYSYFEKKFGQ